MMNLVQCYTVILTFICFTCWFTFNTSKDWLSWKQKRTGYTDWCSDTGIWRQGQCVEVWPYEVDIHRGRGWAKVDTGEDRERKRQNFVDDFYGRPLTMFVWYASHALLQSGITKCNRVLITPVQLTAHMPFIGNKSTNVLYCICLQCFDAVGWAAGRASGL